MWLYDIIETEERWCVVLPPLHYSDDIVFFYGTYQECKKRAESWKMLVDDFKEAIDETI